MQRIRPACASAPALVFAFLVGALTVLGLPGPISSGATPPVLAIADATKVEGNSGTSNMVFTVTVTGTHSRITVNYSTSNGTAGAPGDYTARSGTAEIYGYQTQATFTVPIVGDTTVEPNETFTATITTATAGVTMGDSSATGTITNDDIAPPTTTTTTAATTTAATTTPVTTTPAPTGPRLAIADVTKVEGNSGTSNMVFTVTVTGTHSRITVNYSTSNGTASAPGDYTTKSGVVEIYGYQTQATFTVPIVGDTASEPDETFTAAITTATAGVTVADDSAIGTITNDDTPPSPTTTTTTTTPASSGPRLAIADVTKVEGNSGTSNMAFTVTVTGTHSRITVNYSTSNGTASAPSDYTTKSGVVEIYGYQTLGSFAVPIAGDTISEPDETFTITITTATAGVTVADGSATGTITNDDGAPSSTTTSGATSTTTTTTTSVPTATLAAADASKPEGNSATSNLVFTIVATGSHGTITVDYSTSDGTAIAPYDYTARTGTVTISSAQNSATIEIPILGDLHYEGDDTFTVRLENAHGATIADSTMVGTITNDDAAVELTIVKAGDGAGTVTGPFVNCGNDCIGHYSAGTSVTFQATAGAGSRFAGWNGPCTGSSSTCSMVVGTSQTLTAVFYSGTTGPSLALSIGAGKGTLKADPPGIICPPNCSQTYQDGTVVTLTATPAAGNAITGWQICTFNGPTDSWQCGYTAHNHPNCGTAATCTFTVVGSMRATVDIRALSALNVSLSGTGSGTVTSSPPGIACGTDCTEIYLEYTSVTLTATPATGSTFVGWSGACTGPNCSLSMNAAKHVTAEFSTGPAKLDVVVQRISGGDGSITSDPPGISCGTDCTESFPAGTIVTLTATPSPGSYFSSWQGTCQNGYNAPNCTVTADRALTNTARFISLKTVTITRTGDGSGTVSGPNIDCGNDCTESFRDGQQIVLTATPAPGSFFSGWSGPCSGDASTCSIYINEAKNVQAEFRLAPPNAVTLTVALQPELICDDFWCSIAEGGVTSVPEGIDCYVNPDYVWVGGSPQAGYCQLTVTAGTVLTLNAAPTYPDFYAFTGWTGGGCSGTGPCAITLTTDTTVTAAFNTKE